MSSRTHRCKHVSWCVDSPLPVTATPDPRPNNGIVTRVHVSPPQACGRAPDEEDLEKQSTDQFSFDPQNAGLRRSSPVISRRCRHISCGGAALSEDPSGPMGGTCSNHMGLTKRGCPCLRLGTRLHLAVGSKFRLAEKKHMGRGMGHCSAQWEMEKENAHLLMVDLVLEMLEVLQWTLTKTKRTSPRPGHPSSKRRQHHQDEEETVDDHKCTQIYSEVTQLAGSDGEAHSSCFSPLWKAECLARQLILDFGRRCFPSQ
ncbi:uncharacterized protein LOC133486448 [Phyllopteryx taeniolatus]|uniref:uncharacterized protein LOC133486448 n=1 Tax=Phyllopteryx taeniolatus TaxID=161469 RepID=UPI002AD38084|nr:uncharacterized protein LOC133486448 [Phyllopteryx taeniolatus]